MSRRPKVVWLHSLARSGSSITVYAAAAPWKHAVADEVIGPWDRTGAPYHYPREQRDLVDLFKAGDHRLTDRVVDLTNSVLTSLANESAVVISKWPHLRPEPEEFSRAFPNDARVYLIRNPLHRLNSLHRRGWTTSFGPNQDLLRYKQFARWWLAQPHRLSYDELRSDPRAFFRRLYSAWEMPFDEAQIESAVRYMEDNYHASSLERSRKPRGAVLSEREFALPDEALDLYLNDPFILDLMREMGWSTNPADYGGTSGDAPAASASRATPPSAGERDA